MTDEQREALRRLCDRYHVEFDEGDYIPAFDLPDGWVNGWVGGLEHADKGEAVDQSEVTMTARRLVECFDCEQDEDLEVWVDRLRDLLNVRRHITIFVGCSPEGEVSS